MSVSNSYGRNFYGPMTLLPEVYDKYKSERLADDIEDYESALYAAVNFFYSRHGTDYRNGPVVKPFSEDQFKRVLADVLN